MSLRFMTANQISEMTGIDRRTVKKRLAGLPFRKGSGRGNFYDMHDAFMRIAVPEDNKTDLGKQLERESLKLEAARAAKMEIEVGQLRGELVAIDEVAKTVEREYSYVRSQFTAIPSKLAKPLSMIADPHEVQARLQESIDECLTELTADKHYAERSEQLDKTIDSEPVGDEASEVEEDDVSSDSETESSGVGGHVSLPEPGEFLDSGKMEDE